MSVLLLVLTAVNSIALCGLAWALRQARRALATMDATGQQLTTENARLRADNFALRSVLEHIGLQVRIDHPDAHRIEVTAVQGPPRPFHES